MLSPIVASNIHLKPKNKLFTLRDTADPLTHMSLGVGSRRGGRIYTPNQGRRMPDAKSLARAAESLFKARARIPPGLFMGLSLCGAWV